MVNIQDLNLITSEEACKIIGVNRDSLRKLIKNYDIPHKKLPVGNIFLREDIVKFQNSPERKENLKHRRKSD